MLLWLSLWLWKNQFHWHHIMTYHQLYKKNCLTSNTLSKKIFFHKKVSITSWMQSNKCFVFLHIPLHFFSTNKCKIYYFLLPSPNIETSRIHASFCHKAKFFSCASIWLFPSTWKGRMLRINIRREVVHGNDSINRGNRFFSLLKQLLDGCNKTCLLQPSISSDQPLNNSLI